MTRTTAVDPVYYNDSATTDKTRMRLYTTMFTDESRNRHAIESAAAAHLSVAEAKQQRHAHALARGHDRGRHLVHGLPRRARLRPERHHDVLEPEQRYQDERGPHRLARPARRRRHLVVAVHAAVVPLEA